METVNLPIDLLRAFVTVIDLGGYTRAAEVLHRTQPAVSLQMRRLEDLLGRPLIGFEGRELKLSESGETLAIYARQLLRINDEVVAKLAGRKSTGALRVGLPTDFAVAFLQETIADFARRNPFATLEITCDLSTKIREHLHRNELDIAVAILAPDSNPYLVRVWEEQPIWVATRADPIHELDPVPLATHPEGCEYRRRMISALRSVGREWRIAYSNPGIGELQKAVSSGIGVSALTRKTLLPDMRILTRAENFPPLEKIGIGLFYKHSRLSNAGLGLVNDLISSLDLAATPKL